jgi:NADH:ubiquinone oxidoreductase subunit F (NADH-binding)
LKGSPYSDRGDDYRRYAIGATQGFVYTRIEYPLAIERLNIAIEKAREYGFLGKNILGTGWDFDIEVRLEPAHLSAARRLR